MDSSPTFERYYNLSLRFLSFRPRSEKELQDYLTKKKVEGEIAEKIIGKLKSYKFIDDLAFAKFWIEQKTKIKPKALSFIKFELKQKGIDQEIIEEAMQEIPAPGDLDLKNAKELIERRTRMYRNETPEKAREKLMNYLARRGFSYDTIKKALD